MRHQENREIYNSARWQKLRRLKLDLDPLCAHCAIQKRTRAAEEVDHILAIGNGGEPFEYDNLQSLCTSCHSRKTAGEHGKSGVVSACGADGWPTDYRHPANGGDGIRSKQLRELLLPKLEPARIPVEMVCGPPGSGKSSYVSERIQPTDTLIDLDEIQQGLSGLPVHHTGKRWLRRALELRNDQLRALSKDTRYTKAWFIIAAADPADRRRFADMLGATVTVLTTPLAECIRRIRADESRAGITDRLIEVAAKWWQLNPHLKKPRPLRLDDRINDLQSGSRS